MSNIVLKFLVYEMETGNFTVYVTKTGKISGLRNGNWKFYGFYSVNQKNFPTPNPGVLLQILLFYSKPWYFAPNPDGLLQIFFLLQTLVL